MKCDTATKPHVLYRCYDATDRLIYIGVTSTTMRARMVRHRTANPPVYEQTVRWTTEPHPDRESALNAEANAIYRETPPLNRQFNPEHTPRAGNTRVEPTADEMRDAIGKLCIAFGIGKSS